MLLFINGVSRGIRCDLVGFWVADLDAAFDILTGLVQQHWLLDQAILYDGEQRLRLPVEAIDGLPVQADLQELQAQWEALLTLPD